MSLITISQSMGWMGEKIAKFVADSLNLELYDIIVAAAQSQEMKTCSLTALDAMDRLSLEKKIEAVLLKNNFNPLYIHVTVPDKGIALV